MNPGQIKETRLGTSDRSLLGRSIHSGGVQVFVRSIQAMILSAALQNKGDQPIVAGMSAKAPSNFPLSYPQKTMPPKKKARRAARPVNGGALLPEPRPHPSASPGEAPKGLRGSCGLKAGSGRLGAPSAHRAAAPRAAGLRITSGIRGAGSGRCGLSSTRRCRKAGVWFLISDARDFLTLLLFT